MNANQSVKKISLVCCCHNIEVSKFDLRCARVVLLFCTFDIVTRSLLSMMLSIIPLEAKMFENVPLKIY